MEAIIAKARKQEIWRLLSNMPITVGEAFRPKSIKDSWRKCGFSPLDTIMILSKCSLWDGTETFSVAQKRNLIDNIPLLYPFVELRGRVSDLEMETVFNFLPPLEKPPLYDLAQLAVNRDRCCIVTHPGFYEGRAAAVLLARAKNSTLKQKAPPKTKKVVQEYTLWSATLADKFTQDDIKFQLHIRGVHPGPHCKKKAGFAALWQENSARPDIRPPTSNPVVRQGGFEVVHWSAPEYANPSLAPNAPIAPPHVSFAADAPSLSEADVARNFFASALANPYLGQGSGSGIGLFGQQQLRR